MLAMTIHDGRLVPTEMDRPAVGPGEVLIKVAAAGINRADLLQLQGAYPPPPGAPAWPGLEVSGTVVEIGSDVTSVQMDDDVVALLAGGGYAEYVAVDARHTLPLPRGIDLIDGAGLPEACATAWWNFSRAHLAPGEAVLVRGASGGIGTVAVQVAQSMGARVFGTAGGPERVGRVEKLGAIGLDHHEPLLPQLTPHGVDGVDVILDVLGAGGLAENLALLTRDGRLIVIGMQKGRVGELDLPRVLDRQLRITGSLLRPQSAQVKAQIMAALGAEVWPWIVDGHIRPVIHRRYLLTDANEALAEMSAGGAFGTLLLTV